MDEKQKNSITSYLKSSGTLTLALSAATAAAGVWWYTHRDTHRDTDRVGLDENKEDSESHSKHQLSYSYSCVRESGDLSAGIGPTIGHLAFRGDAPESRESPPEGNPPFSSSSSSNTSENENLQHRFHERYDNQVTTMWEALSDTVSKCKDKPCHGHRVPAKTQYGQPGEFQWQSYEDVFERVKHFSAGLTYNPDLLHFDATHSMKLLGLMAPNCSEWVIAEYGAIGAGATTLPLFTTLPRDHLVHILNLTGVATVVCSEEGALRILDAVHANECPTLKSLIILPNSARASARLVEESPTRMLRDSIEAMGLVCYSFKEVERMGKDHPQPLCPPDPETVFSICFTSGSTGLPKGALITHRNMLANVASTALAMSENPSTELEYGKEVYLSYLPLAHQMERTFNASVLAWGGRIGFGRGETRHILDDMRTLRPTIFSSVPRLLSRLKDKITHKAGLNSTKSSMFFNHALNVKLANLRNGDLGSLKHRFWDLVVFNRIASSVGLDRCKIISTGSAPTASTTLEWLRVVFSCSVLEGYGQTEVTCTATVSHPCQLSNSNVGRPIPSAEFRLISVPAMGYLVEDEDHQGKRCLGRGEICIRGPCVMRGYYRDKAATDALFDRDGFLHTGDIGMLEPDGTLRIIDRRSTIFKLSVGEWIVPQKIESILTQSSLIHQAFVYGTSFDSKIVAIIVPDNKGVISLMKSSSVDDPRTAANLESPDIAVRNSTWKEVVCKPEVKKAIREQIYSFSSDNGLSGYEIPADIHLSSEEFSPQNGLLTATFKLQRENIREVFQKEIKEMYKGLKEPAV